MGQEKNNSQFYYGKGANEICILQACGHSYYSSVLLYLPRYTQPVLFCYFNIKSKDTVLGDENQHVAYSQPSTFQRAFRRRSLI